MTIRRTALISWDYTPSASGLAIAAREIAESLVAGGVEVSVYTLDRSDETVVNGVRLVGCLPKTLGLGGFARKRMALGHLVAPRWFFKTIEKDHETFEFDCLEATNWYAPGAFASRISGLPFITRHSTPAALTGAVNGNLRDRLDGRYALRLEAQTARRSSGHIFNTESHGQTVRALYRLDRTTPSSVIGLSLPPERLKAAGSSVYPKTDGAIELLFVGRPEPRKGFDVLIEAVERLAGEMATGRLPAFRLRMVGIGNGDLSVCSDAARRVLEPMGRQSDAELDALYRAAHIVVAPSRYESFGLVYQEALAFGRPVVALANDPSARHVIGESGAGHLAGEVTGDALAAALRPLIFDQDLRETLRAKALQAAGGFSRKTLANETFALYEAARDQARRAG